jgi:hypothetical protein
VGEELFTSMNPLDVKIWILGRRALHTSRVRPLTTSVPRRPFPVPANRRSRRPSGDGDALDVEAAPVAVDAVPAGAEAGVFAEVAVVPVAEVPVALAAGAVAVWEPAVEALWLLPPQLAGMLTASSAPRTAPARLHSLRLGELMGNLPRRELIGATGWSRARVPVA